MPEPDLAAGPAGDALGDRRAAVLLEGGRVEHAITDRLALLALEDTLADFLSVKLQANIRLARPHPVPFPIAHHAAARQNAPVDPRTGAQRSHQLHHWGGAREIPDLLYINSRVVVALVHVGIGIALQIGKPQPGAVRRTPHLLRLVELPAERPVDFSRPFDGFHKFGARAAHHQADGILAIAAGMSAKLAEHAVSLAAAASAAEEDFEHLTLQQPHLGLFFRAVSAARRAAHTGHEADGITAGCVHGTSGRR